jgi:protein phosphatase
MAMIGMNIIGLFMVLMLLLISLIILFACKPWRYFSRFRSSSRFSSTFKVGDLQRPLISDDGNLIQGQTSEVTREYDLEGACYQNDGLLHSSLTEGRFYKQRLPSSSPHFSQGESFVLEVISEPSDNALVGQTLKLPAEKGSLAEVQTYDWQNNRNENLQYNLEKDRLINLSPRLVEDQSNFLFFCLPRVCNTTSIHFLNYLCKTYIIFCVRSAGSWLFLEVIAGPAIGLQHAVNSTSSSKLPVKLGRVSPSDLALKDSEVSGKHAQITWNSTKFKWELVDMGSLNGTLVNSHSISHPDLGSRKWGNPVELASDDIITLGTTTKVYVRISSQNEFQIPFKIGVASDPMAMRRGGRKLPMEDVCHYKWPLPGANKFGLFCVCDGHGGSGAAQSAIK